MSRGRAGHELEQLKQTLARINARIEELTREDRLHRKLGFSTERIRIELLRTRKLAQKCQEQIQSLQEVFPEERERPISQEASNRWGFLLAGRAGYLAGAAVLIAVLTILISFLANQYTEVPAAPATTPSPAALDMVVAPMSTPTPQPTVTSTPVPQPTSMLSPTSAGPKFVKIANTGGQGAYLRRTPKMADKLIAWSDNTLLEVVGEDVQAEGRLWHKVKDPRGNIGWIPTEYIVPATE